MAKVKKTKIKSKISLIIGFLILAIGLFVATKLVQKNQENRSKAAVGYLSVKPGQYVCGAYDHSKIQYCKGPGNCKTSTTAGDWVLAIDCNKVYPGSYCKDTRVGNFAQNAGYNYMAVCLSKDATKTYRTYKKPCDSGRFDSKGNCIKLLCEPNYVKCSKDRRKVMKCNSKGTAQSVYETCSEDKVCGTGSHCTLKFPDDIKCDYLHGICVDLKKKLYNIETMRCTTPGKKIGRISMPTSDLISDALCQGETRYCCVINGY